MFSSLSEQQFANLTLSQVLAHPTFIEDFESFTGSVPLPKWMCELYARFTRDRKPASRTFKAPKPKVRAVDCKQWIKRNNHIAPADGIRKRGIQRETISKFAMPRPVTQVQYQRHAIHLMHCLLSTRKNASPFTLVLDDLNQSAHPFLTEMALRGLSRNINVVIVSFETTQFHPAVRQIQAYGDRTAANILSDLEHAMSDCKESLVIVDSMLDAVTTKGIDVAALFNLVVMKFASTLVGVYHTDVLPETTAAGADAYAPEPLEVLKFMATSIITCRSFAHVLAVKAARDRSLPEPTFGILAGAQGVVQCLNANDIRGVVLEAEFRRKSGRPESETFFLRPAFVSDFNPPLPGMLFGTLRQEFVILMEQHPVYKNEVIHGLVNAAATDMETSFNLGLTDKQKIAREGVVLPYFDAQRMEGGEGGRILYDMGSEDDFDEEEDEI